MKLWWIFHGKWCCKPHQKFQGKVFYKMRVFKGLSKIIPLYTTPPVNDPAGHWKYGGENSHIINSQRGSLFCQFTIKYKTQLEKWQFLTWTNYCNIFSGEGTFQREKQPKLGGECSESQIWRGNKFSWRVIILPRRGSVSAGSLLQGAQKTTNFSALPF